jgi:hypothetical protein
MELDKALQFAVIVAWEDPGQPTRHAPYERNTN